MIEQNGILYDIQPDRFGTIFIVLWTVTISNFSPCSLNHPRGSCQTLEKRPWQLITSATAIDVKTEENCIPMSQVPTPQDTFIPGMKHGAILGYKAEKEALIYINLMSERYR
jgi:hypothetical protein